MRWFTYCLLFCTLSILFTDCSGCSKSGREAARRKTAKSFSDKGREERKKTVSNEDMIKEESSSEDYNLPDRQKSSEKNLTITELAQIAEPCVFLVNTFDYKGNGIGLGTGFFIESSGIGVSNYHVFEGGKSWTIQTSDDNTYDVTDILEYSEDFDYVIFQVENIRQFPTLPVAQSTPLKGEDIIVLGNPRGLESTLTRGIVSSIRERKGVHDALIQVDAAISPGSSGSPVINLKGEVIGIATMKLLECENCNFAMNIRVID